MKKYILLLIVLLMVNVQISHAADISAEKRELIDQLLVQVGQSAVTVGKQFSDAFIQQMTIVLKQSNPNIDPKAYVIINEEITSLIDEVFIVKGALSEIMYPIYNEHFTVEELREMIAFNNTELGKKIIKVMPIISQEGMQAGQKLGESLAPKIQERIAARFEKEGIK